MKMLRDPEPSALADLIQSSTQKAAKWLKNLATGEVWYWPAEAEQHARVAAMLGIARFEKGLAVMDSAPSAPTVEGSPDT